MFRAVAPEIHELGREPLYMPGSLAASSFFVGPHDIYVSKHNEGAYEGGLTGARGARSLGPTGALTRAARIHPTESVENVEGHAAQPTKPDLTAIVGYRWVGTKGILCVGHLVAIAVHEASAPVGPPDGVESRSPELASLP
eukprot:4948961-Prymnesium_polylepis.1